jgi:NADH dehydrogenase
MTTLISWTTTFLTMNRGQLTITERQARARQHVERPTQPDAAAEVA